VRFSATLVLFTLLAGTASAQWLYRDLYAPRAAGGTVDGKAPAPRTASGNLDLSGIWQTDVKYNANLAVDLKAGDVVMLPWGQALYDERQGNNGKDDPEGFCLQPGLPRVNDGSLLFLQHMVDKFEPMRPPEHKYGSRLAIVFSGSPLFTQRSCQMSCQWSPHGGGS